MYLCTWGKKICYRILKKDILLIFVWYFNNNCQDASSVRDKIFDSAFRLSYFMNFAIQITVYYSYFSFRSIFFLYYISIFIFLTFLLSVVNLSTSRNNFVIRKIKLVQLILFYLLSHAYKTKKYFLK